MYEAYSFFITNLKDEKNYSNLITDYSKFLISISPVIPHLSNECLKDLSININEWPSIDEKYLIEENVNIVVQFNGKKERLHQVKKGISEEDLVKEILSSKVFDKMFKNNNFKKNLCA